MTIAATDRFLDWDGCHNVRDLGGLGPVRRGALVRADRLDKLTEWGWEAAYAHGIRTVVDLRNGDEYGDDAAPRPDGITTLRVPLDGIEDREFWDKWWDDWRTGTPVYYRPFMERFPERVAAVVRAIARAEPGGVVYHCAAGRDRTGMISLVLLALAGATAEEAAADHALSAARMPAMCAAIGRDCDQPELDAELAAAGTSNHGAALETLRRLDAESYLRAAGVTDAELAALRNRLV
ncbi:tyrosine-protein phosphatase [Streptomyces sp. E11-3]|uniref:tyrosine-protein phosphatase n=1 Tax=Streptomyces sp. E11-3 TaxID=3110112 RepID=UPI00397F159A